MGDKRPGKIINPVTSLIIARGCFGFRDYAMRHIMVDFDEPKYD